MSAVHATAAIRRLSGLSGERVHVDVDPATPDVFTAWSRDGVLHVRASGAGAAVAGYAAYARRTGVAHVSRFGTRPVDRSLPDDVVVERRAQHRLRVAYNITVGGYTTPFFDWPQWEAELDLLAASGVNAAHVTLGQELVYLETFTRFGYTEDEILRWVGPPSHQPWLWLNNIENFGAGTSRALVERRAELARRVLARMTELDIAPILPGFVGTVPPEFGTRNPGAPTVPQGRWFLDVAGPQRPDWLDSTSDAYAAVAETFYAQQRAAFGSFGRWAVDLLHEGGKTGGVDLGAAAHGVQRAMTAADRTSVWVMQGWMGNPRRELLDAVDRSRVLVLDLTGEGHQADDGFGGVDWVLGILPNYGGRTVLYGDLAAVAALPGRRTDDTLVGLTNMAEGVANNPVLWDLFSDVAWADREIDLGRWLDEWLTARYGSVDEHARAAWRTLLATGYGPWRHDATAPAPTETDQAMVGHPVDAAGGWAGSPFADAFAAAADDPAVQLAPYGSTDSVIAAVPSLHANQASLVGPRALGYPDGALVPALRELLAAAGTLHTAGFEYDLADVARQLADDVARTALRRIAAAAEAKDLDAFDAHVVTFLELVDALDGVLGTSEHFLLGGWLAAAEAWGSTAEESTELARAAKRLLTCWGYADATMLADYATRSWAGLVGDYYRARWSTWLEQVRHVLTGEPTTPVDWYRFADDWVGAGTRYPSQPRGDLRNAAARILELAARLTGDEE